MQRPVFKSCNAQDLSLEAVRKSSPSGCTPSSDTSAWCFRTTCAHEYGALQSAWSLHAHTRQVASCEAESTTPSLLGCHATDTTFLLCPSSFCAIFPLAASKRMTWLSPPPVTTRELSVLSMSKHRMPGAVDWCGEKLSVHAILCTSATAARPGCSFFLRVLDRPLASSCIRPNSSGVSPISAWSASAAGPPPADGTELASWS
mmetsp:Transcript_24250/g.64910  ORF Transcript_24250/g.64910 Transcript_24250/m.64910 type:complete len:203 (-) Transcript_24250:516-1124(-)